jgi:hypothetical protein
MADLIRISNAIIPSKVAANLTGEEYILTDLPTDIEGYKVKLKDILSHFGVFVTKKVSLTSAQILQLNTTPIELLPAPGVGKMNFLLDAEVRFNLVSTAYTTNLTLQITCGSVIASNASILTSITNRFGNIAKSAVSGAGTQFYTENTAMNVTVGTGNPLAGNGTLDLYITYKILTL